MMNPRLLSVARARAEISAGIPGRCAVSVRVLDDVTLRIHAGELLLLQAPEAMGQSMLLAALAGHEHSRRHRYVRSVRHAAPGLRIRRAALHLDAVHEIMRGWQEAQVPSTSHASRTLYLLRASRAGALTPREAAAWRRWGREAHERRDGIVIACSPLSASRGHASHASMVRSTHEPAAWYASEPPVEPSRTIRRLELRAGRLHSVRTPRQESKSERLTAVRALHPWSAGGSSDAHAPTASHPSPRASPES
ncbi:hypothetical protein [Gemmatimonas sp.]|uniref:hypothetical protein n=1 Tax=Gemmatimonas sp. TaxID=1962908 RepID=UPI00286D82F4|nr:hypothetical protein [Gemmatimonas sp.]